MALGSASVGMQAPCLEICHIFEADSRHGEWSSRLSCNLISSQRQLINVTSVHIDGGTFTPNSLRGLGVSSSKMNSFYVQYPEMSISLIDSHIANNIYHRYIISYYYDGLLKNFLCKLFQYLKFALQWLKQ